MVAPLVRPLPRSRNYCQVCFIIFRNSSVCALHRHKTRRAYRKPKQSSAMQSHTLSRTISKIERAKSNILGVMNVLRNTRIYAVNSFESRSHYNTNSVHYCDLKEKQSTKPNYETCSMQHQQNKINKQYIEEKRLRRRITTAIFGAHRVAKWAFNSRK